MNNQLLILIIFLNVLHCYCWYWAGKERGKTEILKKLEKDIRYVESLMISAEMKREHDNEL